MQTTPDELNDKEGLNVYAITTKCSVLLKRQM